MAKKITLKNLTVTAKQSMAHGSVLQLSTAVKKAEPGQQPERPQATFVINNVDPDWADQFKAGQKIDVDLNIS